jgi:hypothetical protein
MEALEMAKEENPKAPEMTLEQWRQSRLVEAVLPSGLPVVLRRISLMDLMGQGEIPDTLMGFVELALKGNAGKLDVEAKHLPAVSQAMADFAQAALVRPSVGDQPSDTTITIDELDFGDREFIFNLLNEDIRRVSPFLDQAGEQGAADQPAPDGD